MDPCIFPDDDDGNAEQSTGPAEVIECAVSSSGGSDGFLVHEVLRRMDEWMFGDYYINAYDTMECMEQLHYCNSSMNISLVENDTVGGRGFEASVTARGLIIISVSLQLYLRS